MENYPPRLEPTVDNLSKALFIVNKHAKTAPNPKFLYALKKATLLLMIENGFAEKKGLHFSRNPKLSQQHSDVLITCGDYQFHLPPTKEDRKELPHLGNLDNGIRNPKTYLRLQQAKALLIEYTGLTERKESASYTSKNYHSPFTRTGSTYFS